MLWLVHLLVHHGSFGSLLAVVLTLGAGACGGITDLTDGTGTQSSGTASRAPACTSPAFAAANAFPVGAMPYSVAVGDFDEDGHLDLVVTNFDDGDGTTVGVLLGNGSGGFGPQTTFPVGLGPWSVAVADLDLDGHLDLVTTNSSDASVSILLGTGSGSFGPQAVVPSVTDPVSVIVGDFDADGVPDLAVTSGLWVTNGLGTVGIQLGTGTGAFGPPATFPTNVMAPDASAGGDFDGDGLPDVAVASAKDGPSTVGVLLGAGSGSLGAPAVYAVGSGPTSVGTGDFNGDGHLDLVATNYIDGTVSILLGTGTGAFGPQTAFAAGPGPIAVVAADFDGDGHVDLAAMNLDLGLGATVSVLQGNGTGSFHAPSSWTVGKAPYAGATGDFDGDGLPDLAVADSIEDDSPTDQSGTVSVLLNGCGGGGS